MEQTLSKAERRKIRSATRQYKKALREGIIKKETPVIKMYPETRIFGVSRQDLERQRLSSQPKSRSIEVLAPYSQKVFDSLHGLPQGGVSFFDKSNRKESW